MKNSTRQLLGIGAVVVIAAVSISAVSGPGGFGPGTHRGMMGGPGMMGGGPGRMMGGDPVAFTDQRLASIKEQLGITPEQEPAWSVFEDALRGRAGLMAAHRQIMMQNRAQGFSMQDRQAMMQGGRQQMQQVNDATKALYATLTPEQQATADQLKIGRHCM